MKTVLYDIHKELGGKIIDFYGWQLPVQYESIVGEHLHVRSKAGLFDVSHMGEIYVSGPDAVQYLQYVLTADIKDSFIRKKAIYSVMCDHKGHALDDLIVYEVKPGEYMLVVNASNIQKDYNWLVSQRANYSVTVENVSDKYAQIALQGPKSPDVLQPVCDIDLTALKFFSFMKCNILDIGVLISRTGYTGEDGFEMYLDCEKAPGLWNILLKNEYVKPIGLGARDTLRFEACLPLYGHELNENISPVDAGLKKFVNFNKFDFIGKDAMKVQQKTLMGFKVVDKGIPRNGFEIMHNGIHVGYVTSGSFCPYLNDVYAMGIIENNEYDGDEFTIIIRNKPVKAIKAGMPFYQKKYKK